ncbi:pimeloyl-[acyl-carrier protein] methyl ester esterase-like [Rhodamnia argentea]|uniref:Pimeloyl-[acyl-carrier protein] methyl ester esterase-like n=1 Tax=Rhodamnia argentea TaxID=178133 RepID=A0A8B8PUQ3_9MYRT|nr:pimeloyl-[acyl-carrier protein] methyl ester esterase-like [Rhodamnia argentea]
MLNMPPFLSFVTLYETYLRRCFANAGLSLQTLKLGDETTIQFWGPKVEGAARKPPVVLIHGFGPPGVWQWRKQVQCLAPHFDVYVPDLVFFGGSATRSAERTEIFQAASVARLADELNLERFHVVGTSYGGFVAYHVARMRPERVGKVVIASSGVNMTKGDNEALLERAKVENIEDLMLPETAANLRTLIDLAVHKHIAHMVPDFVLNDVINKLYSENRKEKIELLKGLTIGREDEPHISAIEQDVLLIWGDHDQLFPLQMATELKEIVGKKVKLEVMENTAHVPQVEDHLRFNSILKGFLM